MPDQPVTDDEASIRAHERDPRRKVGAGVQGIVPAVAFGLGTAALAGIVVAAAASPDSAATAESVASAQAATASCVSGARAAQIVGLDSAITQLANSPTQTCSHPY
jgi:hypothetical protein